MIINWMEWLGYLASALIAISLLMNSIVKLRWTNLVGSVVFAIYGALINAIPVVVSNTIIVIINIYYLYKIYGEKEYFKLIEFKDINSYLRTFFDFYKNDIKNYFPKFNFSLANADVCFFILRNMVPACVFIASELDRESLEINLDYVMPEYRDFKIGTFIFEHNEKYFMDKGYKKLICYASNDKQHKYLKRMGFKDAEGSPQRMMIRYID